VNRFFPFVLLILSLPGCAAHAQTAEKTTPATANGPDARHDAEALRRDLLSIVAIAEQQVWNIDRYEIEDLMSKALVCVCRTTPAVRELTARILQDDIRSLGGPALDAWVKNGKDIDEISTLMTHERTAKLLDRARREADKDCPFHFESKTPYEERNRATHRLFISTEGGGLLNTRFMNGEVFAGGGGSGRFMVGYGLDPDWSVRLGAEMGGAGLVDKSLATEDVNLDFYTAVPLVFRHRSMIWHQDIEVAGVAFGAPWNGTPRFAARVGGLIGLTYTRIGILQPWGGLKLSGEYAPKTSTDAAMTTIRIGFRFGINFHL